MERFRQLSFNISFTYQYLIHGFGLDPDPAGVKKSEPLARGPALN